MSPPSGPARKGVEVEFVMLANHVDEANGLLNILGGGFDRLYRPPAPEHETPLIHFGVAVSAVVPWNETNHKHGFTLVVESEDGDQLFRGEGELEVGRPTGSVPGSDLRAVHGINASLPCPPLGGYRVTAKVGDSSKSVSFRITNPPGPQRLAS